MMKILLCEYSQESNSFNPFVWETERFRNMVVCGGLRMRIIYNLLKSPVKGMADAVKKHGGKSCYGFAMRAMSGGKVSDESVAMFIGKVSEVIKKKGPFDGILLSLHGATISETDEDACGYITAMIRDEAPGAVIGLALDMHANITKRMEEQADFICGFQTYPHVDFYETGYRAAEMVMEKLEGSRAEQVYFRMPMMVPASGYTSEKGRFGELIKEGKDAVGHDGIKDFTLFMMQPWLDIHQTASCVTFVSDEPSDALERAEVLGRRVFDARDEFLPELEDPAAIVEYAAGRAGSGKPVVIAEPSDSPNAGAVGDSIEVLEKMLEYRDTMKCAFSVMDPDTVALAEETGRGNRAVFAIGGGYTPDMDGPCEVDCEVRLLHKGKFRMAGPAGKGLTLSVGKTAVLRAGRVDIMVCEKPGGNGDLNFYRGFGIDPLDYDLVSVKANTSFRESYKSITDDIHIADTYGAAGGRLTELPFSVIDKENFYPFCEEPEF